MQPHGRLRVLGAVQHFDMKGSRCLAAPVHKRLPNDDLPETYEWQGVFSVAHNQRGARWVSLLVLMTPLMQHQLMTPIVQHQLDQRSTVGSHTAPCTPSFERSAATRHTAARGTKDGVQGTWLCTVTHHASTLGNRWICRDEVDLFASVGAFGFALVGPDEDFNAAVFAKG